MAAGLFPTFDVPAGMATGSGTGVTQYLPGPLWDFETGDFVSDGAGRTLYGSGKDAWVLWCIKSILTQRGARLGYGMNEGIEADEAFSEPDREAVESAFERTVTEALLADPLGRTKVVRNFSFTWEADSLMIECEVVGADGSTADITAKLDQ